ncbi:AMP-binding protein [Mycobacterium branderi]|uniref:Cyclohexanecarboxylate-CoA ligase n=1 Tax=Mycobacterium branderi TaxID=43348 RepID=A0A7I7WD73_9MYCO|nr:AMP-binding protein [Mycobacterium branderi]MCV7231634.1 AMP-binding protein [Mycobacterium branderi]ORA40379.1 cyclohexanecarboxylate-CoA ligase [Mycobacterium branderi]BBZ14882.1 long-chain-fatty-acid--CoA ligase [Mycobacterium branderi]
MGTTARSHAAEGSGFDYGQLRDMWYRQGWYSRRTCIDAFKHGAAHHGGAGVTFVTDQAEATSTVAEIHRAALAASAGLQRLGVAPGDAVAVQLTNRLECAIAYQAVLLCGAVLVPIVHVYGANEVGFILAESAAKVLVMPARFGSTLYLDRLAEYARIDTLQRVVIVGAQPAAGYLSWAELGSGPGEYVEPSPEADDVCVLLYTSGTTSAPKGVQHSHNSLLAEQRTMPDLIAADPGDSQLVTFPPGHVAGLGSMLRALLSGTRSVFLDSWDPHRAAELIERFAVTSTAGTPFHLLGLLQVDAIDAKLATLREFLTGATTVTEELGRRAHAAGINSYRSYGLTEHPTVTGARTDDPEARLRTDGKPLPGSAVRIIAPDGADLPSGVDGEVIVRGPDQFIGYRDPALNTDAFTSDSWFRTGDLGRLDAEGRLVITGRIKDVIIRGGETISARQVEEILNAHPAVGEGVAVPAPHPTYGEVVAAVVVLKPGATLSLEELTAHFADSGLARQKTPERLVIVESVPRTAMGKVSKAELRQALFGGAV